MPQDGGRKGVGVTDEQLDELISCYLDGELSQQEKLDLESRLQSDPEAARRLRFMQEARLALTRSQTFRLPDNFAARVLEAAKQEARRLDLPATHPICLADKPRDLSPQTDAAPAVSLPNSAANSSPLSSASRTAMRWSWGYAAAASLLIAGALWWKAQEAPLSGQAEALVQENRSDRVDSISQPPPDHELDRPESKAAADTDLAMANDNVPQPALAPEQTSQPTTELAEAITSQDKPNASSLANNETDPVPFPRKPEEVGASNSLLDNQAMLKDLANVDGNIESLQVLMVVDVTLTQEAWENQSFSKILNEYGIRYERPIVADESLKQALENSNLVSKAGSDTNPAAPVLSENDGQVELVFIQARAARIDNAIKDIFERVDEYPSLYFDLSMDGPCQDVVTRLEASTPFENDGEDIFGIATAVRNDKARIKSNQNDAANIDEDKLGAFAGTKPRGAAIPLANRRNRPKAITEDPVSMNPISTVLFVLRKPQGASGQP